MDDFDRAIAQFEAAVRELFGPHRREIERLKGELTDLKAYKRWAEHRILRSDHE